MNFTQDISKLIKQTPFDAESVKGSVGTLGRTGLTVAVMSSSLAVNAGADTRWQQSVVNPIRARQAGLYVSSDWTNILEDANDIPSIGAGIPRQLDTKWLLLSLNENNGGALLKSQFDTFKATVEPLSCLRFLDCHVAYRQLNEIIRTTIILEKGFRLSMTYFLDGDDSEITFSLDYEKENILSGYGKVSDVARAIDEIIKAV